MSSHKEQSQFHQKCPICSAPAVPNYKPFCSKRCADVDLNRWLSATYAIAGDEDSEEDGALPDVPQNLGKKSEEKF